MYSVHVVENSVQAKAKIEQLVSEGFSQDHVYVFAHDKDFSKDLTDATDSGSIGVKETGLFETVGNLFKSRGDELRSKFESLGLSEMEAGQYEEALNNHKIVVVASNQSADTDNTKTM